MGVEVAKHHLVSTILQKGVEVGGVVRSVSTARTSTVSSSESMSLLGSDRHPIGLNAVLDMSFPTQGAPLY